MAKKQNPSDEFLKKLTNSVYMFTNENNWSLKIPPESIDKYIETNDIESKDLDDFFNSENLLDFLSEYREAKKAD